MNRTGRFQVLSVPAGYEEAIAKERLERILQSNVVPKEQGIRGLAGKNDWPRFLEEESEVYEREELDSLFAVCDEQERLWYEFFLMTGMREQEVMHCSWADGSLSRSTITVRYKPHYGFSVGRDAGSRRRNQSSTPAPTRLILPTFPTTEMPPRR